MTALVFIGTIAGATSAPAHAAQGDQEYTPEQLKASILPLERGVIALEGAIEPLETREKEGSEIAVKLKSDLLFDYAEYTLSDAAVARIAELVDEIPGGVAVSIAGHTDSRGDSASNLTLSRQRAQTVADAVAAARRDLKLTVEGFGEDRPVAQNESGGQDNPEGRAQNRRVEIRYTG